MESWHYQQTFKDCKPFIFENYGYPGQTANLAMKMFETELIKHETWQYITELSHEKERLNYLLNHFLDPSYTNIKTAFDFLVKQFNEEQYPNISEHLTVTLEKVKTYEKPPEEPILDHLDRLHDNVCDLTPNQLKESLKNIRVQIVAEGFEKDGSVDQELKQEGIVEATDTTSDDRHSAINIKDSEGTTALMRAVERGDIAEMSELFDCPNLDLTVYDHEGLTFEYHVFGKSVMKYTYRDALKYGLNYDDLKHEKSNLEWDKIMKVIEFLLAKENVNKTHLFKACIMFGDNRVIDMVLKSVLKTAVITKGIKRFIVDIAASINPVVVKYLSHFESSLPVIADRLIILSVMRYNCPDTSAALIGQLDLAHIKLNKALETVLCLQSIPPAVLPRILKHSTFNLNDRDDNDNATVFMWLCRFGSYETVSKLMEQTDIKIDYKVRDRHGYSCFMWALKRDTEDMSLLLLRNPKLVVSIKSIIKSDDRGGCNTLLIEASKQGHMNSVLLLMDYGAMVNTKDINGRTALFMASLSGQESIVEKFLSVTTIDINAKDAYNRQTALHAASKSGHDKIVKLLSEHEGIEINAVDRFGRTALHYACSNGYLATVAVLVAHSDIDVNVRDTYGDTALHIASKSGHKIVKLLSEHEGIKINAVDDSGRTALHHACSKGCLATVAVLLAHSDINVNAEVHSDIDDIGWDWVNDGMTALHIASKSGQDKIVKLLTEHEGIEINAVDHRGYTALHYACSNGYLATVAVLLAHSDIDANVGDNYGTTPLHIAAGRSGQDKIVKLLSEHEGIEINAVDYRGFTALHCACLNGYLATVAVLLAHSDIDVNVGDKHGDTALHIAASRSGQDKIVKLLSEHEGIEINAVDCYGSTALHGACSNGYLATVAVLLAHSDIDVNVGNNGGFTALHTASLKGHTAVMSHLIDHTAIDVNAKNKHGDTALHAVSVTGQDDVVSYLITHSDVQIDAKNEDGETAGQVALRKGYNDIAALLMNLNLSIPE